MTTVLRVTATSKVHHPPEPNRADVTVTVSSSAREEPRVYTFRIPADDLPNDPHEHERWCRPYEHVAIAQALADDTWGYPPGAPLPRDR